jgi:hypothetical protein
MPANPITDFEGSIQPFYTLLDASITASEVSNILRRSNFASHCLQVINGGSVSVQLYVSNDGVTFAPYGSPITTSAVILLDGCLPFIQVIRDDTTTTVTVTIYSNQRDIE